MICAEEIAFQEKGQVFWRGCNHVYQRECLKMAKEQRIPGCPRCFELEETKRLYPQKIAAQDDRSTQEEEQEQDQEQEAAEDRSTQLEEEQEQDQEQ